MSYHEEPFWPLSQLLFLLVFPFILVYWSIKQWWCRRGGGHDWEDSWGSDTPSRGTVVKEYDYCRNCPASRSRDPREIEG